MVGVLVHQCTPLALREWPEQRVHGPGALLWTRPETSQERAQACSVHLELSRRPGEKLGRGRSALRKRDDVEQEVLEGERLERFLALWLHVELTQCHPGGYTEMT